MEKNDPLRYAERDIAVIQHSLDALISVLISRDPKFENDILAALTAARLDAERTPNLDLAKEIQDAYDIFKGLADEVRAKRRRLILLSVLANSGPILRVVLIKHSAQQSPLMI